MNGILTVWRGETTARAHRHIDTLCRAVGQDVLIDQRIVKNDVGPAKDVHGPHGEEIPCARTSTNEIHFAVAHRSFSLLLCSVLVSLAVLVRMAMVMVRRRLGILPDAAHMVVVTDLWLPDGGLEPG